MNYFQTWNDAIVVSFQNLWSKIVAFVPELLGALIVLVVGLVLASVLSKLVYKLILYTRVDKLIHKIEFTHRMEEVGLHVSFSALIAWIVRWFLIVVTLIAVVDILRLTQVTQFLQDVALYIPNVIVAVIILAIGIVVGQFVHDVVEKSAKASHVTSHTAHTLSAIAQWSLVIFSLMASLVQLGVATNLIQILFTGFVAALAIGFGLAFGLGGKEHANKWLDRIDKGGK